MRRCPLVLFLALLVASCRGGPAAAAPPTIAWREFSAAAFAAARADGRLLLLDLGTGWCHWCHVMERTTWADPEVRAIVAESFVAIDEDADRRLDLAARYQDYGWPALVVFDADGRELWKHRGFVPPARLAAILRRLVADPRPLAVDLLAAGAGEPPATATPPLLSPAVEAELRSRFEALHDDEHGGFGFVHKFLDGAAAEWLLVQAREGDAVARARLLRLLDAERALHDPVWGGAWQYSHGGVWTNPHFEKVMPRQLADLRAYSLAYGAFGRPEDLAAARGIAQFLTSMLRSPAGPFYASQDADAVPGEHAADYFALDDAGRRARGLPRIERSLWSRENGQAIQGLCALLAVAPDRDLLRQSIAAAEWIVAHRRSADGTFRHGDDDVGGPFLADSLEMAQAFLALHELTVGEHWLDLATTTARAIGARFAAAAGGFAAAASDDVLPPVVDRAENAQLARLAHRLSRIAGDADGALGAIADQALAAVVRADVALVPGLAADVLLAAHERQREPLHVVIVGERDDPAAAALHAVSLRLLPPFRHVEWLRPGQPARDGSTFPTDGRAAAFACGDGTCSPPLAEPAALAGFLGFRPHAAEEGGSHRR
jgi:uncharacterized protein YyaL (SSP411 family)